MYKMHEMDRKRIMLILPLKGMNDLLTSYMGCYGKSFYIDISYAVCHRNSLWKTSLFYFI